MVDQPAGGEEGEDLLPEVSFGIATSLTGHSQYFFDGGDEESEVCSMATNEGVCNCDIR